MLPGDMIIKAATHAIIAAHAPVRVMDGDREMGVVGSEDVLTLIAGDPVSELDD